MIAKNISSLATTTGPPISERKHRSITVSRFGTAEANDRGLGLIKFTKKRPHTGIYAVPHTPSRKAT
ncbi:hypothetical protein DPMN_093886 [Dreissena polymorpha]|uniref:Uncharacterized protein n=1 Tax=Dreissena polymorpha TaxID=45954 RepID=A0A9D4L3S5_DREPO|nr:hypothetical protein DPMN_093886 [Dreissena polymorpha]